eukprot:TRINITY_DN40803_c0_g4_i1.p1 TRINITY_DN40803_c0_g4~~TRINITY_DN40803_c0_g4_i1.p1  ORF type:complete len:386 (-),score=76.88 TRINITY_DN40803_c0_g4_i1:62-1063(-)
MGANLVSTDKTKNMVTVSMPVRVFEPRSYLERICDSFIYLPQLIGKAAAAKDPVERMKYVIAFAISGLHNTCKQKKPFNPILGETYEATYKDGTRIFCEQTCHHPPITSWQIFAPDGSWKFYGYGEYAASFRGNSIKGGLKGPHWIEFADGTSIKYDLPIICMSGFLFGDRIVEYTGSMHFADKKNRLAADVHIAVNQGNFISNLFSKKNPSDYLEGEIYSLDKEGEREKELSEVLGTWLGCVEFDGKSYWSYKDEGEKHKPIPVEDPLPSDSRFREDLIYLLKGETTEAQDWKHKLEVKQRRDRKLRSDAAKTREKEEKAAEKAAKKAEKGK